MTTNDAETIVALERAALDKWFQGDTSGYLQLWSEEDFSYFDGAVTQRVDSHDEVKEFVLSRVEGKLSAKDYDFVDPRVQHHGDMAVLTYQLHAQTNLIDMHYNCIEVFHKEASGWRVIHSTWSFIRPMDIDFNTPRQHRLTRHHILQKAPSG